VRWVLTRLVDGGGIDVVDEEPPQLAGELLKRRPFLPGAREGVNEIELKLAEKEVAQEPLPLPFGLARLLGNLTGLGLGADVGLSGRRHDSPRSPRSLNAVSVVHRTCQPSR
jgi:hypothetical protein